MFKVNNKHIDVVLVFLSLSLTYFTTFSSASIINFEQVNVSWVIWILPSFNLPTRLSIFRNKMFKVRHKNNRIFSDNKDPVKYLWRSFVTKILKMIKAIYFRKKSSDHICLRRFWSWFLIYLPADSMDVFERYFPSFTWSLDILLHLSILSLLIFISFIFSFSESKIGLPSLDTTAVRLIKRQ